MVPATRRSTLDLAAKRVTDIFVAGSLLLLLLPVILIVAIAIKLDSRGPVFYRCRRIGRQGRTFDMLKFRKMADGANGPPLTLPGDKRLTRVGRFLTASKLDELPQLWNVLRGEMALVGPRPEDPSIVGLRPGEFEPVLSVQPGVTGLCQLAFAEEGRLLDEGDRVGHYVEVLLPKKLQLDHLYAERRSTRLDLAVLLWTFVAVAIRRDVAVNRRTAALTLRKRPATTGPDEMPIPAQQPSLGRVAAPAQVSAITAVPMTREGLG